MQDILYFAPTILLPAVRNTFTNIRIHNYDITYMEHGLHGSFGIHYHTTHLITMYFVWLTPMPGLGWAFHAASWLVPCPKLYAGLIVVQLPPIFDCYINGVGCFESRHSTWPLTDHHRLYDRPSFWGRWHGLVSPAMWPLGNSNLGFSASKSRHVPTVQISSEDRRV